MRLPDNVSAICWGVREEGSTYVASALLCTNEETARALLRGWEAQFGKRGELVELLITATVLGVTARG